MRLLLALSSVCCWQPEVQEPSEIGASLHPCVGSGLNPGDQQSFRTLLTHSTRCPTATQGGPEQPGVLFQDWG
ncbi:hypothetical protein AV530_004446 [Patagioenas fasciata monilis]|uniref:Uncharacterized protein n=1 Tax=Patagioenas fasciata monilis TaxID=372326 RepID=A0A1V4JBV2_PATFA|nr:hypothetical protein AV530_004446 [Patagioenas fasciata monilis]